MQSFIAMNELLSGKIEDEVRKDLEIPTAVVRKN